jgi:NAD(P)-dependent dehydrogenase (short-subunit alcohol dehydrogenase family)
VVVGSAQGIGRAIVEAFAAEGAHVALVDRAAAVEKTAADLRGRYSVNFAHFIADATDPASLESTAQAIEQGFGPVDHLVYAAGAASGQTGFPFWGVELARWEPVVRLNFLGAVNTFFAFLPAMIERGRGSCLVLASVAGQIGSQTDPPYSAAKAALINFAQCAAKDLAPYDIRVNALNPGMVDTELSHTIWTASNRGVSEDERPDFEAWAADKLKRMVPLNRWQEPADIAAMAVFLASKKAKNVTGQAVNVDGGFVMHS